MNDGFDELRSMARARHGLPAPTVRRLLRQAAGLSQDAIARTLGVTRPTVTRWELGERTPRGALLLEYLQVLETLREVQNGG